MSAAAQLAIPQRQSIKPDSPQEREWRLTHRCRNCGKELVSKRSTYCNAECNNAYWARHSWAIVRLQVFRRDGFKCACCGLQMREFESEGYYEHIYEPIADPQHWMRQMAIDDKLQRRTAANWVWDYRLEKRVFTKPPFVADHIHPIALGGDEWDLNNLQTLCIFCNKLKTRNDSKNIAKQRRIVYGNRLKVVRALLSQKSTVSVNDLATALHVDFDESARLLKVAERSMIEKSNPFDCLGFADFWRFSLQPRSLFDFA